MVTRNLGFRCAVYVGLLQLSFGGTAGAQEISPALETPEIPSLAAPSAEAPPTFQIEVVVFAYNAFDPTEEDLRYERASAKSDRTRIDSGTIADPREISLDGETPTADKAASPQPQIEDPYEAKAAFGLKMLESEDLELTSMREKLERLDAYTVLVHGGWIQDGLPEKEAREINMSLFGNARVDGHVKIYLSRFLHVNAAIDYHGSGDTRLSRPVPITGLENPESVLSHPFRLRQTRRMRSSELHYLDHPAFGVLIEVRPHDRMQEAAASSSKRPERLARPPA